MNLFKLLLLNNIVFVISTPYHVAEFSRYFNYINDCLGNITNNYTISLYNKSEIQITRNDGSPIDQNSKDSILSKCIDDIKSNFTINIDLESILTTSDSGDTSDVSYTEASGPFGNYNWESHNSQLRLSRHKYVDELCMNVDSFS